jgi:hypothetical protein|tara:strand:+ start:8307 stop:9320 length:1014 start_codon:yes stop_codon:yes gene_type:complete
MAVLSANNPTLLDLAKRTDPDGTIATVVEILDETNEMLKDMSWVEGNLQTGHVTTVRVGLPAPTWRKLYGGVQPTKSITAQVTDSTGMLEAFSEVDVALADLNGNTAAFRLSEDRPHIEGINQELQDTVIYGNETTEPEAFTGLAPRFNSLTAESGDNIIDAGGTGSDNGSIWLIVWGENTCHGIIPKGSQAGLKHEDLGRGVIEDADGAGGRMMAYRTHYRLDAGLSVRDWRYVVRIANVDKSLLTRVYTAGTFSTGANLPDLMFQALERVPALTMGRPAFYMSRDMRSWVRRQLAAAVQNSTLTVERVGGVRTLFFDEVPMRRVDALTADEARVT